jgi:hypothetical protein
MPEADYDILIVGAGLAGLHCALRLKQVKPSTRIAIAEVYKYVGGRVVSYNPPDFPNVRWENGAGRIHSSHKMLRDYLERYGLHLIKLSEEQTWRPLKGSPVPNPWPHFATMLSHTLGQLKSSLLARHTVSELSTLAFGAAYTERLLAHFPYRAEVFRMRADLALKSLSEEMRSAEGFFVVQEGLSALIKAMRKELEEKDVEFLLGYRCSGVRSVKGSSTDTIASFIIKKDEKHEHQDIRAKKVILAVHSEALKGISPFSNLPVLKHLTMEPLLRTYGIFPTPGGKPWFHGMKTTVTNSPLRFIIPVNPKQGTIMTSYTDAQDTRPYMKLLDTSPKVLEKRIMKETRELFPELDIPNPLFFKAHPWYEGCTYWLPGFYSPEEESRFVMNPLPLRLPTVFVCGESYSLRQAWMEGALEHAEAMLRKYLL